MQLRRLLRSGEQLPVKLNGPLVPAQPYLSEGVEREIVSVGPIGGEQFLYLLLGLEVQLALREHLGVLESGSVVVWREIEEPFEQQLSINVTVALHRDTREQTHGLDVMAVPEQEGANEFLGPGKLTVREQGGRCHDLWGQFAQPGSLRSSLRGICSLPGDPVQALQHAPAGRQRRADVHSALEGLDRLANLR